MCRPTCGEVQWSESQQRRLGVDDILQLLVVAQLLIPVPNGRILIHELFDDRSPVVAADLSAQLFPLAQPLVT